MPNNRVNPYRTTLDKAYRALGKSERSVSTHGFTSEDQRNLIDAVNGLHNVVVDINAILDTLDQEIKISNENESYIQGLRRVKQSVEVMLASHESTHGSR